VTASLAPCTLAAREGPLLEAAVLGWQAQIPPLVAGLVATRLTGVKTVIVSAPAVAPSVS